MSKYVKNLLTDYVRGSLEGVQDALLVDMVGMSANVTNVLRGELEAKGVRMIVIKNTLAKRAVENTPLAPLFSTLGGSSALCWGCEDIVSLAKEITSLTEDKRFAKMFVTKCGVMDGERLDAETVKAVSKWPSRVEQLSLVAGQILGPGAGLAAAILGPGSTVAGQIASKAEEKDAEVEE